jgi:alkylation response protein AidB-like acyl-CoA dehydrogenase
VTLGIARAALDDIGLLATTRTPLLSAGPLAVEPTFLHQLARADTDLRAAHALLFELAEDVWATASEGADVSLAQRAHIRAAAVHATDTALAVVTTAYRAGGSDALYLERPLQRRLRDVLTAGQHFLVRADTLTAAGKALTGVEPEVPVF